MDPKLGVTGLRHARTLAHGAWTSRLPGILLMVWISAPGCLEPGTRPGRALEGDPATRSPLEPFLAFLTGEFDSTSFHFGARLVAQEPADDLGLRHYRLRDRAGRDRVLAFHAADRGLPIGPGRDYAFQVDYVGGAPAASGMLVWDSSGLVFAAATDQQPATLVLRGGVPGFRLQLLAPLTTSRDHDSCYEAIYNRPLEVSNGNDAAVLFQGDTAALGVYEVRCLVAQQVRYASTCADAGLPGISYTIARVR